MNHIPQIHGWVDSTAPDLATPTRLVGSRQKAPFQKQGGKFAAQNEARKAEQEQLINFANFDGGRC